MIRVSLLAVILCSAGLLRLVESDAPAMSVGEETCPACNFVAAPHQSAGALVSAQSPIRLVPQYSPGQILRYSLEFHTTTQATSVGAIENPQAPKLVDTTVNAIIRVEILSVTPDPARPRSLGRVRLRNTYERIASLTKTDLPDPQVADNELQLGKLEGKSLEFTIAADGTVTEVQGLDDLFPEARAALGDWLGQLSLGISHPPEGIVLGQKWISTPRRAAPSPIEGIIWRTESTYLRNEPCRTSALTPEATAKPAASNELCAVIVTRSTSTQRQLRDQTPADYRTRGLRTGGQLKSSGEGLTYVSLASGFVVSVTQESEEESDITITDVEHDVRMRYAGRVRSRSQISLISDSPIAR